MKRGKKRKNLAQWSIISVFSILILVFTVVVWREQKAGGSCYQQAPTYSESYFCRLIAPANLPTDYLVIVGVGGVLAALATLRVLSRQAQSMRYQTTALHENVAALVASERAWVKIQPDPSFRLTVTSRLDWVLSNTGRTAARITTVRVRCKKYSPPEVYDPSPVFRKDPIAFPRVPLAPKDTLNVWSYIEAGEDRNYDGLTQQNIGEIRERGYVLVAYASVDYLDSFERPHVARFCYYFATPFDQFRINLNAPAAYHECD